MNKDLTMVVRVRSPRSTNYGFPGGKLNKSEDPRYGCIREIKEEIGVELTLDQCREEFSFKMQEKRKGQYHHITYYVVPDIPVETKFTSKCLDEIADIRWDNITAIGAREERERLKEVIERIKKARKGN